MTKFLQLVVSGLSDGSGFALVGMGLTLVFRTTNALNFAQGVYAVLGGLTTSALLGAGWSGWAAVPLALVLCVAVASAMGLVTLSGRSATTPLTSLIVTLGLTLIAEAVELVEFGDGPRSYSGIANTAWNVRGVLILPQYAIAFGAAIACALLLYLLLRRTIVGNALVACSDSHRAARIVGLDVRTLGVVAFAVAGLLGGLAGVLITPVVPVSYASDVPIAVNAFAASAFGGLVSVPATLAGGLLLGISEKFVVGYWNAQYELAAALVVMLALIGWRSRRETVAA
jgi:branched-chain amino acid transport system permease protein